VAAAGGVADLVVSPYEALSHLRDLQVTAGGRAKVAHGIVPGMDDFAGQNATTFGPGERVRISEGKRLLAVAQGGAESGPELRLVRVFN